MCPSTFRVNTGTRIDLDSAELRRLCSAGPINISIIDIPAGLCADRASPSSGFQHRRRGVPGTPTSAGSGYARPESDGGTLGLSGNAGSPIR